MPSSGESRPSDKEGGGGEGGGLQKNCFQPFGPLVLKSLSVELGFWIPIAGGILDCTSKIFWDFGFHKLNFLDSGIRIPFQGAMLHLQGLLLLYVASNSSKRYWDCKRTTERACAGVLRGIRNSLRRDKRQSCPSWPTNRSVYCRAKYNNQEKYYPAIKGKSHKSFQSCKFIHG